jgi:RHS repeat-associated protein
MPGARRVAAASCKESMMALRALASLCGLLLLVCVTATHATAQPSTPAANSMPSSAWRFVPGLDEPLVAMGVTTAAEDAALDDAIAQFRQAAARGHMDYLDMAQPLLDFVAGHPKSPWRMSVQANLGSGLFRAGYFSVAMAEWRDAWQLGRESEAVPVRALADRSIGELARMYARLGDSAALDATFEDVGTRATLGPGEEMLRGAHEARWLFEHQYEQSFLCGPAALRNLLKAQVSSSASSESARRVLEDATSGPHGYTLAQLSRLAGAAGIEHQVVYRDASEPVPVPSVIHWKLNHYAAIVGQEDGFYHVQDPTFAAGDLWVSRRAIDSEASGFFLVPGKPADSTPWRVASRQEEDRVYGMGQTTGPKIGSTTLDDLLIHDETCSAGMCVANAHAMLVSLHLIDTPVGYHPALGPSAKIRLVYNQREASQPANFSFFNLGPKWTLDVLSWIQDDPVHPGQSIIRAVAGGGFVDYSTDTNSEGNERRDQSILVRIPPTGTPTSYELDRPDGSKQVFAFSDGAQVAPRRIFLTQIVDPDGNALQLNYDSQRRLTSIKDATGRFTTFAYNESNPLLISRITDPFGRHAQLTYDAQGRLHSITDVINLTTTFGYDTGDFISSMTTPYGTSTFVTTEDDFLYSRSLETTDPLGNTERVEFRHAAPGIPASDPDNTVPAGINATNDYLQYRNTFFWDKYVYKISHTDYTLARRYHWLHDYANNALTSNTLESLKNPLRNRVWFTYHGQLRGTVYEGDDDRPMVTARVIEDGTTQKYSVAYEEVQLFHKPAQLTDPMNRMQVFFWGDNDVDLTEVKQGNVLHGVVGDIALLQGYDARHHPKTTIDAAGQATHYTYNDRGQIATVTDALQHTIRIDYDGFGRAWQLINANNVVQLQLVYDAFDRVYRITDSEGYSLTYLYDALDRLTSVTYPDGTRTQYGYLKLDLNTIIDRLGRATTAHHDANRRLRQVTDAMGQSVANAYYPNGMLQSTKDPNGNVTRWNIDIESRPTFKYYADGRMEGYAYGPASGLLTGVTDAMGQTLSIAYWPDNRIKHKTYLNARVATPSVSYFYGDTFARLESMTDGIGQTGFNYYPLGVLGALHLMSEDGPYGNDLKAFQYDAVGRVTMRSIDGDAEAFQYDALGRVQATSDALGGFSLSYLGQSAQLLTRKSSSFVGTIYTYESNLNDRRLKSITNLGARSYQYTTDALGNVKTIDETALATTARSFIALAHRKWTLSYDGADRLTDALLTDGEYAYGYDRTSNITSWQTPGGSSSATYGVTNQMKSLGGVSILRDANGNTLDDGHRTYQWDAAGRLVGIGYSGNIELKSLFRYDGLGRRIVDIETSNGSSVETRYLWCGVKVCQSRDMLDNPLSRYFDEGENRTQTGETLYYDRDHLGSVRDLTDSKSGAVKESFDYDPYGNLTAGNGAGESSAFRYAGMMYHATSGLYLSAYRAYDPIGSRWLSRDPIAEAGGVNLYAYVFGNPVNYADESGLAPRWLKALIISIELHFSGKSKIASELERMEKLRVQNEIESVARKKRAGAPGGPPGDGEDLNCVLSPGGGSEESDDEAPMTFKEKMEILFDLLVPAPVFVVTPQMMELLQPTPKGWADSMV